MRDIFNFRYDDYPFVLFSMSHLTAIFFMLILILLLYMYRNKYSRRVKEGVRWGLIISLAVGELFFHIWYSVNDMWSLSINLPFQLCSISIYLCIFMLVTKSRTLFEIAFFSSMTGAFIAMITPELFFGFPHVRYFQFFLVHAAIVLSCMYMVWMEGYMVTFSSLLKSFFSLNLIALAVYGINVFLGSNYMFLSHKPYNSSPIDYLGEYPWYLLSLEGITFLLFLFLYFPFHFLEIVKK
jgi:hypothetical integral membrane protein (TIGR02206 family)